VCSRHGSNCFPSVQSSHCNPLKTSFASRRLHNATPHHVSHLPIYQTSNRRHNSSLPARKPSEPKILGIPPLKQFIRASQFPAVCVLFRTADAAMRVSHQRMLTPCPLWTREMQGRKKPGMASGHHGHPGSRNRSPAITSGDGRGLVGMVSPLYPQARVQSARPRGLQVVSIALSCSGRSDLI
jgi:hypothetical protein